MDILEHFYNFITNPITGYLIGFVLAVLLTHWQFSKSSAGRRINKILKAVADFRNAKVDFNDNGSKAILRNSNRFSLGVTIDRLNNVYDAKGENIRNNYLPNFIDYETDTSSKDRWGFFNTRIKPVIDELSQYSFLGWFWFGKLKKLKAILNLCYRIQSIVEIHDAIMGSDLKKAIEFDQPYREYFKINESKDWLEKLEIEYKELASEWKKLVRFAEN